MPDRAPPPSFERIFASEFDYVFHSLRRLGIPDRDLPDLTHDTFVIVYRKLEHYDATRPLRPWLFGIAFRVASDHRGRHQNQRENLGVDAEPAAGGPGPDDALADAEARRLLAAALAAVPLDRRAVLVMHDLEEHPMPEVAAALEVPLNTAYSRLRIARDELTAAIKRLHARRGHR